MSNLSYSGYFGVLLVASMFAFQLSLMSKDLSLPNVDQSAHLTVEWEGLDSVQIQLTPQMRKQLIRDIWQREGLGKVEYLTFWSPKEGFASVGFNHSLWYPTSEPSPINSFAKFAIERGLQDVPRVLLKKIPPYLNTRSQWAAGVIDAKEGAPESRAGRVIQDLQTFFLREEVQNLQLDFMLVGLLEFEKNLIQTIQSVGEEERRNGWLERAAVVQWNFRMLAKDSYAVMAMADYVNFKGTGLTEGAIRIGHETREVTLEKNWGLLQVLSSIDSRLLQRNPLLAFQKAAEQVLQLRVQRWNEDQIWLRGWRNRLKSYRT